MNLDTNFNVIENLEKIVKLAFSKRRKTIANNLKPLFTKAQIESVGINQRARAEELSVDEFVALTTLCI